MQVSALANINKKSIKLTVLFLLSPLFFFAQSLTGLWTGTFTNDSSWVRKDQSFEIALTEYRGKVYGYSRSEFIVNDTLYYIVKRVKGTIEGDVCEVKDDEIVSYNFPTKLEKKVKVTSTFYRNKKDSIWYLAGKWKTNQTKEYYTLTGKIDVKEEKDLTASKIFPHLEELKLANDVAFYKDRKKETTASVAAKKEPEIIKPEPKETFVSINKPEKRADEIKNPEPKKPETAVLPKADVVMIKTEEKQQDKQKSVTNNDQGLVNKEPEVKITDTKKTEDKKEEQSIAKIDPPLTNKQQPVTAQKPEVKVEQSSLAKDLNLSTNKPDEKIEKAKIPVSNNNDIARQKIDKPIDIKNTTNNPVSSVSPIQTKEIIPTPIKNSEPVTKTQTNSEKKESPSFAYTEIKKETSSKKPILKKPVDINGPAALIEERKSEFNQFVNFKSDSLELALYDNGEIDGDTVSVIMNGEIILAKQGLKASAIKKTIYIT
ncbi:MAG: hypothetical protein E6H08_16090, partial [Bacteroidetes bacterium]